MSKTLGQALDDYLSDTYNVETVFLYHDRENAEPHVIVTASQSEYDYTEVFTVDHNVKEEIEANKKIVASLRQKVNGLKRDQKSIESAIAKLVKAGIKS